MYVRLREQTASASAGFRYWRASNSSLQTVEAAEFYSNLGTLLAHTDSTFGSHAATLRLPGPEGQRQRDQALSGMLMSSNNYVGNQSNYVSAETVGLGR